VNPLCAKYWEIIADNLHKSRIQPGLGRSCGSRGTNDLDCGRAWLRKRFIVSADEKLTAFLRLEASYETALSDSTCV
jgi:hypothetical protein